MAGSTPPLRIRQLGSAPVRAGGRYVLYWMTAFRRTRWNFALQHAVEEAKRLARPLVVVEPLVCDYPWASDRLHAFVLAGMRDNAADLADKAVHYHPWVETRPGEGRGLLEALAAEACLVVGDDFPAFFLPRLQAAAAARLDVRFEVVDANGLLPLAASERYFARAVDFRRHLQRVLEEHLASFPEADPVAAHRLPSAVAPSAAVSRRWPPWPGARETGELELSALPLDHGVAIAPTQGGAQAGTERLASFLEERLPRYIEGRLDLDRPATSGLSPYLHFGHVSTHQVFSALAQHEGWHPGRLGGEARGGRAGFWGMSEPAEAFLDQLVTWRELGFNSAARMPDSTRYESLPEWARATLAAHAGDRRPVLYDEAELEEARTHDEVWNAAQRELVETGSLHNYLRMLWGKKILEWSPDPETALARMIHLNNKLALDGRDPNSYSGILWCLGRYDRPWGPERPIFGRIRYMSSASTRRKTRMKRYLARFGDAAGGPLFSERSS